MNRDQRAAVQRPYCHVRGVGRGVRFPCHSDSARAQIREREARMPGRAARHEYLLHGVLQRCAQGKKNPELVPSAEGPHSREHLQKADGMQPVQQM